MMGAYKIIGLAQQPQQSSYKIQGQANQSPAENEEDAGAYLDQLPPPEGFLSKLPRNIIAGLASLGHSTMNYPHDITQIAEKRLQQLGEGIKFPGQEQKQNQKYPSIAEAIPYQQEQNFAQMLGQKGEGTFLDKAIQKGIEYAPEIATGTALLKGGIGRLTGTHHLNKVAESVAEKGINDFEYPNKLIEEAKKFLPKTEATKEMIKQVANGDYKAAFKMQSQIGHHQRKLLKSPLASENSLMAPKAGELKQNMLNHLDKILRYIGQHEEAELLKTGISNYKQYKKVVDAVMPYLKYFGIPSSIITAVGLGYKYGKKALSD